MGKLVLVLALTVGHVALGKPRVASPSPSLQRFDDFEDEVVEAGTQGPLIDTIGARKNSRHESLIRVRQDFRREMLRSGDAI
jgi:hypothetical protein